MSDLIPDIIIKGCLSSS